MTSLKSFFSLLASLILGGLLPTAFAQAPANDNFADATPLYGSSVTFTGTLANATFEEGESPVVFNYFGDKSVWWSWTAANSTDVIVRLLQRSEDRFAAFAVYDVTNVSEVVASSQIDWNILDRRANRYLAFSATQGKTYHIRVSGEYDTSPEFTLQLIATNRPVILAPPQSQIVDGNSSPVFDVTAAGIRPFRYQWQFQGNNLPGETAPALIVHRVGPVHEGSYSVVVSNVSGVTTSSVANLTLSGTNALPALAVVKGLFPSDFNFTVTRQPGKTYEIETSTNLVDFVKLGQTDDFYYFSENGLTTTISVYRNGVQRVFRPSLDTEDCIGHLKAIDAAVKLWTIETKQDFTKPSAEYDLWPYLNAKENFVCPSGGTTYGDSYRTTTASEYPICLRVFSAHRLP